MNLYTKWKQTHRHRKQTYSYPKGKGGGQIRNMIITDIFVLAQEFNLQTVELSMIAYF